MEQRLSTVIKGKFPVNDRGYIRTKKGVARDFSRTYYIKTRYTTATSTRLIFFISPTQSHPSERPLHGVINPESSPLLLNFICRDLRGRVTGYYYRCVTDVGASVDTIILGTTRCPFHHLVPC